MNKKEIKKLADRLKKTRPDKEIRIMEVCGTHTAQFFKTGVRDLFPENIKLIDGPGCPVCVTPDEYLDRAIEITKRYNVIIASFGDMIKVPSSHSSLGKEMGNGMDIEIVYSPMDALHIAKKNPDREVVFLSVGFETTAPTEAATLIEAKKNNINNFSILCGNKLTPPAVKALLDADEVKIDGFILPGHVSAVTGKNAWNFIADHYRKPTVISGFESYDLLIGTLALIQNILTNNIATNNMYKTIVKDNGNNTAQNIINEVFSVCDSSWRGLGKILQSGLTLREPYKQYNARDKFPVTIPQTTTNTTCRCGELLRGLISPPDCPLFRKICTPHNAIGPCMVSSEGPCAAYYKYTLKQI